ncbi:MAG: hypothetical protein H6828_06770 [Planctomycetes bacterium]|nr:hypothetical protein [Planctomycetota bacterium]
MKPGYDPESQLYLNSHGLELPEIPAEPDRAAAVTALELLKDLLKDFPFVADCDRSAALATILTALIRKALPTAPMFAFRAPKMGSGKSLLADVVARIATGRVAEVMSQGKDEEEDNKRILTVLMEGTAVVCIDNVERPFGGAAYCSVLTQETYKGRVLGVSRTATVPTRTLWIATGNNLVFVGDITTRVVVCDLDPKVERPEEREFDRNLHQYVAENRGALVAAGLTVLRAYHVAGRPRQKLKPFGRFERWSDWVRSALVWLGEADPCAGRVRIDQVDPVREQLVEFLHAWREAFGDTAMSAAQALEHAEQNDTDVGHRLGAALRGACDGQERADARRLGMWLQRHAGRIEDGLKIVRAGDKQGTALWRVDRAGAR